MAAYRKNGPGSRRYLLGDEIDLRDAGHVQKLGADPVAGGHIRLGRVVIRHVRARGQRVDVATPQGVGRPRVDIKIVVSVCHCCQPVAIARIAHSASAPLQ